MSMLEVYIKSIPQYNLWDLEAFSEDWLTAKESHPYKRASLLAIINEKLNRYEQEY